MSTIAIYSLKGGVGKTTLAVNLAWVAATASSRRTLLWDLDPQAASSFLLAAKPEARAKDQAQSVFAKDVEPDKLIEKTATPRLDLLPADASLRGLDLLFHEEAHGFNYRFVPVVCVTNDPDPHADLVARSAARLSHYDNKPLDTRECDTRGTPQVNW